MMQVELKTKIIWDSGFDYEVGYFERESEDVMPNTVIVELITGSEKGLALRTKNSIHLYCTEVVEAMHKKYKYFHHILVDEKSVTC